MAYREFHVEKIYSPPDVHILERGLVEGAQRSADAVAAIFRSVSEQQMAKRKAADQYKFDLGEGKFENDDKIFFQKGLNITQRGKLDIKTTGRISPELEQDQNMAITEKKQSDWQFKKFAQNEVEISTREKDDKYYDPNPDREANKLAAYGTDNDVYYGTRGERLEAFDKFKGKLPQSLKGKIYTSDYVKAFGQKEKTKTTGDPTYKSTTYDKTPFLTPQGTPGVTVDHAKEYLSSRPDGSVARWIEQQVDTDMDKDVAYNKERNPELKKLSDEEVRLYLKANPKENKLNTKDFATRVIEKAQGELLEAADIAKKTDYERKSDSSITGGKFKNDAIGHSETYHQDNLPVRNNASKNDQDSGDFRINKRPGGNLLIAKGAKLGQGIPVVLNPRATYNIRTRENSENVGSTPMTLTGYQLQVYDNKGRLYEADEINNIPLEQFKKLQPQMKIALRGYTIENGNKLGEIASRQSELDAELAEAIANGDVEAEGNVEKKIKSLEKLKADMNLSDGDFSSDDLLGGLKKNGIDIKSIQKDVLVEASESDLNIINKNITQGLDLKDQAKWSPQMRQDQALYQKRWSEAQSAASKPKATPPPTPAKGKSRTISYNGEDLIVKPGRIAVVKPNGDITSLPESERKLAESKGYKVIE